ncbi:alpha/beta hydrolase [Ovoidimarina sediminis]|uniref:alpha/beta hydrolase n=1 Tax=Ovoidimarina sediminis TaxID=3079856 RepID=UPI00290FB627|nr:alpha/beta hydrolase [Rhodophyticola sp. MJ-SS7]MDU8943068.1 alpha/beta hydrolase [Rhodophyticola sp. MJ-SS7]
MPRDAAPYHADLAEGPETARAQWLRADDGVKIRAGIWPGGPEGTVFILPGRCEYIEKYAQLAGDVLARGMTALSVDWRGQGLSQRLLKNPDIGHVRHFQDYQADVRALISWAEAERLPRPWFMLAHSMGGAIGLRALTRTPVFAAAAFSAPMWGIFITPRLKHLSYTLPVIAKTVGLGGTRAPTTNTADYFLHAPFEGNFLTSDRTQWDRMQRQARAVDRFRLGGPSLIWLGEALAETRALQRIALPDIPAHVSLGTEEKIVEAPAVTRLAERWESASFTLVEGAEHEILMERPGIRSAFLDRCFATFAKARVLA